MVQHLQIIATVLWCGQAIWNFRVPISSLLEALTVQGDIDVQDDIKHALLSIERHELSFLNETLFYDINMLCIIQKFLVQLMVPTFFT
jgi:hypothetical protein